MFGGRGGPWRSHVDPAAQLSHSPSTLVVSDPSAENPVDMATSPHVQNDDKCKQAKAIATHCKPLEEKYDRALGLNAVDAILQKLQDDLHELGLKIKHHEDNISYLKTLQSNLDESVQDMQVSLRKYDKASLFQTKKENPEHVKSVEETIANILKHDKSGAAILYRMKNQAESLSSDHPLTKDVIGIVATLGKVDDNNLSRLLSEYLGLGTMMAVVCKTYEGVKALEAYNRDGSIDKNLGLHGFSASIGNPLADRFLVICLEDLRPYPGEVIADDPQRRLALLKPRLPNGETPSGFLGFAVNMIAIDSRNLYIASKNGGLRETLFYRLFSNLQVYKSREDMVKGLTCITNGAISLDGGIIRSPGVFSLGKHEKDIDLKFPTGSDFNLPEDYLEIENGIKETKWKRDRTCEDMKRELDLFTRAKFNYEKKKQEVIMCLAKSSSNASQRAEPKVMQPQSAVSTYN